MCKFILYLSSLTFFIIVHIGCVSLSPVSTGNIFSTDNLSSLRIGASKSAVINIFGTPHETEGITRNNIYFEEFDYFYSKGTTSKNTEIKSRGLDVEFVNDSVNAYLFHSSFSEDNTDFDFEGRKKIQSGVSTFEDVRTILGEPSGIARLPTASIAKERIDETPNTATKAWRYIYITHTWKSKNRLKTHVKQILLFFDKEGKVVNTWFADQNL